MRGFEATLVSSKRTYGQAKMNVYDPSGMQKNRISKIFPIDILIGVHGSLF